MRVRIRSKDVNLFLPIPLRLAGAAIALIPERAFSDMQKSLPDNTGEFLDKATLRMMFRECYQILREYRGLEIVHVEASDGTYVSVRL